MRRRSHCASALIRATAESITYGSALSGAQLNASASVNGTFSYTPVTGTVPEAGNQTLAVVFTPADTTNYNTVNRSVTLTIAKGSQTISGVAATLSKEVASAAYSLNATASSNLTLGYASSNESVATVAANGTVSVVGAGTATLTVSQGGDANYNAAPSVTQELTVTGVAVTPATPASGGTGGGGAPSGGGGSSQVQQSKKSGGKSSSAKKSKAKKSAGSQKSSAKKSSGGGKKKSTAKKSKKKK